MVSCTTETSVREAIQILAQKRIGALPVLEFGRIAGIFSERDVLYRLAEEGAVCLERSVGEVMTAPAITADRHMTGNEALALMTRRRIRHLPVVEDGEMIGFISIGDIVKSRIDEIEAEAELMRVYIQTA
ncbi:MAG TPA: CBS domain-containing protein [Alteraurantiacibacter sp.]